MKKLTKAFMIERKHCMAIFNESVSCDKCPFSSKTNWDAENDDIPDLVPANICYAIGVKKYRDKQEKIKAILTPILKKEVIYNDICFGYCKDLKQWDCPNINKTENHCVICPIADECNTDFLDKKLDKLYKIKEILN